MQKIQILFPDPMMARVRELAKREDVPVSEVIRKATALWLERIPEDLTTDRLEVPVVDAGRCLLDAEGIKEALYE